MINDCTIIRELAEGGQKKVYLANHPEVGDVVVKKGLFKSFHSLERIRREVELLHTLKSEFYPKQYHFNIDVTANEFVIIEEYIEGQVLRDCIHDFKDVNKIFIFLNHLIDGLSIIWDKNIVHRDLKPENIIIRSNGLPCIIDLGIARFLDLESLTKTISPIGPCTPIYASPEQLTNQKGLINPRTDFFAIGIIALELYLGVHPFDPNVVGNNITTQQNILDRSVNVNTDILDNIVQNKYVVETNNVPANQYLSIFANKTIQTQPYRRFRNHKILKDFIAKYIQS